MSNKLLTSAQCDAFMEYHQHIRLTCAGNHPRHWIVKDGSIESRAKTKCQVITKHWQQWYGYWVPPEIHDAEWALKYILDKDLILMCSDSGKMALVDKRGMGRKQYPGKAHDDYENWMPRTLSNFIHVVEAWHEKYGKKEEPPTTLDILEKIDSKLRDSFTCNELRELISQAIAKERTAQR